jgi:hypothetical protein
MMLIRYLENMEISGDHVAVARSSSAGSYFTFEGGVLKYIPEHYITSKIYPQGVIEPPHILDWIEDHRDEVEHFDSSLSSQSVH